MRKIRSGVMGMILAAMLSGCSESMPDLVRPSAEEAQRVLEAALDAWKQGQVKSLAGRTPPVRFVDQDQSAGQGLTNYRLTGEPEPVGPTLNFPVELTLRDRRGRSRGLATLYQVVLNPSAAVLRNDP